MDKQAIALEILALLETGASWRAVVHHSWVTRRRERDSTSKFLDGHFRTESEAMDVARKAIKERTVGQIVYDSARPVAFYSIGSVTENKIGDAMNRYYNGVCM